MDYNQEYQRIINKYYGNINHTSDVRRSLTQSACEQANSYSARNQSRWGFAFLG